MTTCFGHRMTIIRSTRAIMYNFIASQAKSIYHYKSLRTKEHVHGSSCRPDDGHTMAETCSHKDIL